MHKDRQKQALAFVTPSENVKTNPNNPNKLPPKKGVITMSKRSDERKNRQVDVELLVSMIEAYRKLYTERRDDPCAEEN